ncbi:unnamed protein product [Moneuplotes crassus]|uniref:tRNA (guanine(9)-N(1))-methyltransferase n=1 Tax=Euplotes crassus TaxID=5936 RepID=A0AAD1XJ94_EUPCR|nr:unnamed protein product [Moneuplotes crassus]
MESTEPSKSKKDSQKVRKNRQKARREFLESMSKEEREEFLLKEKTEKLQQTKYEQKLLDNMHTFPKVYFDCSFCDTLVFKELKSLILQINCCIKTMKSCKMTDLSEAEADQEPLVYSINITSYKDNLQETWERCGVSKFIHSKTPEDIESISLTNAIYLSPDATEDLEDFDPLTTNFIIGGIVDRTVSSKLTLNKANSINPDEQLQCRRLPLQKYLDKKSKFVLNINTVYEILLRYCNSRNWEEAILQSVPMRIRG